MAHESSHNYSSIPLAAGGVYVGGTDVVGEYASVAISLLADQNGSLELHESFNGSTWYTQETIAYTAAAAPTTIVRPAIGRHFRVRFENTAADAQTLFNLSCKYLDAVGDVTVSNIADLASEATAAAAAGTLSTIDGKITVCDTNQVTLIARPALGSGSNFANNVTLAAGAATAGVDISTFDLGNIFIKDGNTGNFDQYGIDMSLDAGATWFRYGNVFMTDNGTERLGYNSLTNLAGVSLIRLTNNSGSTDFTNVVAGIVGSAR